MPIVSVNPATDETVQIFEPYDAAKVERRITQAAAARRELTRSGIREFCNLKTIWKSCREGKTGE